MLKPSRLLQPYTLYPPAAFRRLCVETEISQAIKDAVDTSRLQAAVC